MNQRCPSHFLVAPAQEDPVFQKPFEERWNAGLSSFDIKPEHISLKSRHI
jgi:putative AlgH/UPF0301 family transcriptional regulator